MPAPHRVHCTRWLISFMPDGRRRYLDCPVGGALAGTEGEIDPEKLERHEEYLRALGYVVD